jgi:hypothetical protein
VAALISVLIKFHKQLIYHDIQSCQETLSNTRWTGEVSSFVIPDEPSSIRRPFFPPSEEDQAAEYAEALGASAPLLDLVDVVFQLHNRGFVWRQVCARSSIRVDSAFDATFLSK